MSAVEIDDGSEDVKKVPKAPPPQEPDNSVFDNEVANNLGIPVETEEKVPADVQQIALPDESTEESLSLPENENTQIENSEEDNSSIMLEKTDEKPVAQTKKEEDEIPTDGGASDISNEDLVSEAVKSSLATIEQAPVPESTNEAT